MTNDDIKKGIEILKNNDTFCSFPYFCVFSRNEWLYHPDEFIRWCNFSEEDLDKADPTTGLIATKDGINCYLTKKLIC